MINMNKCRANDCEKEFDKPTVDKFGNQYCPYCGCNRFE